MPTGIAHVGLFHLDDLRAQITEDHGRKGARHERRQVDHANPFQDLLHCQPSPRTAYQWWIV